MPPKLRVKLSSAEVREKNRLRVQRYRQKIQKQLSEASQSESEMRQIEDDLARKERNEKAKERMRKYRKGIKEHPRLNELSKELERQRSLERREGRTEEQKQ